MMLLAHVLWAGVVVYGIHRITVTLDGFAPITQSVAPDTPPEVPEDLVALAMGEQEAWAQEETLRAMRERYDTLKDWNLVRSAFGVGRRD